MLDPARISDGISRPPPISILVNGQPVACYPGETVAAALLASGYRAFRKSKANAARGPYCNMGVCFDCMVTIDGQGFRRACLADVTEGMRVEIEAFDR